MFLISSPHRFIIPLFILFALFSNEKLNAQGIDTLENSFNLSGQIRPRLEYRDGTFRPLMINEKPAALISERIRFSMDYTYKNKLSVKISPQAVGIWGQANMVQGAANNGNQLALFEAWTKLNLSDFWSIKVGRQVISLDDERLFGELDWAQGGRAHDAASIHFTKNKYEVKGFFSFNQNYKTLYSNNLSNPTGNLYATNDAFPYKWMQTVWAGIPVGENSKLTLLATNLGFQQATSSTHDTTVYYNQTFGANYFHTGPKIKGNLSAYYQCGQNSAGINTEAFLFAAFISLQAQSKLDIGLGSDWLSGNDVGSTGTINRAFNPYFNTGHKFYGNMDYFYSGNGHKNAGLSDSYLRLNYKTSKSFSMNLTIHQFLTPNNIQNGNRNYDQNLGQEADLSFAFKINKFTQLVGGYSCYLNTPTINYLKNTSGGKDYQQWVWVSLNVTPNFLKFKY